MLLPGEVWKITFQKSAEVILPAKVGKGLRIIRRKVGKFKRYEKKAENLKIWELPEEGSGAATRYFGSAEYI